MRLARSTEISHFEEKTISSYSSTIRTVSAGQKTAVFKSYTSTEISTNIAKEDPKVKQQEASQESFVLADVPAVIVGIKEAVIQVKLGEDSLVGLPSILFQEKNSLLRIGQHLRYQIKRDQWGYRYQDFIADESVAAVDISDFEDLLKDI